MSKMEIVLDSSVIAKLFIDEVGSTEAIEIVEQSYINNIELIASELIFYEVGNTIWKHLRKGRNNGRKYIDKLYLLNINYIQLTKELAQNAMKLAHDNNVTFYDAVHVSLCKMEGALLVTEDKLLLNKFLEVINISSALKMIKESNKT
jgi:predicted nucleic acid-binding protein